MSKYPFHKIFKKEKRHALTPIMRRTFIYQIVHIWKQPRWNGNYTYWGHYKATLSWWGNICASGLIQFKYIVQYIPNRPIYQSYCLYKYIWIIYDTIHKTILLLFSLTKICEKFHTLPYQISFLLCILLFDTLLFSYINNNFSNLKS